MAKELIALIDMDGTIVDLDKQLAFDLEKMASPGEPPYKPGPEDGPDWLEARKSAIKHQPGWWRNLPGYKPGFRIVGILREFGFTFNVLTKGPYRTTQAWAEKVAWVREFFPEASVTVTDNKSLTYGAVLVDDWIPYVEGWLKHRPRGLVIMPAHPWNEGFEHPQVIRFTGSAENVEELRKRLMIRVSVAQPE